MFFHVWPRSQLYAFTMNFPENTNITNHNHNRHQPTFPTFSKQFDSLRFCPAGLHGLTYVDLVLDQASHSDPILKLATSCELLKWHSAFTGLHGISWQRMATFQSIGNHHALSACFAMGTEENDNVGNELAVCPAGSTELLYPFTFNCLGPRRSTMFNLSRDIHLPLSLSLSLLYNDALGNSWFPFPAQLPKRKRGETPLE